MRLSHSTIGVPVRKDTTPVRKDTTPARKDLSRSTDFGAERQRRIR